MILNKLLTWFFFFEERYLIDREKKRLIESHLTLMRITCAASRFQLSNKWRDARPPTLCACFLASSQWAHTRRIDTGVSELIKRPFRLLRLVAQMFPSAEGYFFYFFAGGHSCNGPNISTSLYYQAKTIPSSNCTWSKILTRTFFMKLIQFKNG